jgi:phosphate transport system permease protein
MRIWKYSEQDLDAKPFSLSASTEEGYIFNEKVSAFKDSYSRKHEYIDTDSEIVKRVSENPGGIGFIKYQSRDLIKNTNVKIITVRSMTLFAHPDIYQIVNNMRLGFLMPEDIIKITDREVKNWRKLGGTNLGIAFLGLNENFYVSQEYKELVFGNTEKPFSHYIYQMDDIDSYFNMIRNMEGSVGYAHYLDIPPDLRDSMIQIRKRTVTNNIDIYFFIEEPARSGQVGGVRSIIFNTLFMIILTLLFAAPIGIGAAVYLIEYSKQNPMVKVLRFFTETLAGIPSIIFGLFGYIVFVMVLKWGMGLLSGTLTLTIMVLPTLIRATEESLKSVPFSYREESLALGATKWQTITKVVLPAASPGILTGIILSIGRAVGETAAVLFTLGSSYTLAKDLFSSARVLSLHLYFLAKEGISFDRAFATATILIIIILIVNLTTAHLVGRMNKFRKQ